MNNVAEYSRAKESGGFERFRLARPGGGRTQKQWTLMRRLAAWGDAYEQRGSVISAHPAIRDASCVTHTHTEKKNMTKTEGKSDRERGKEVEKKN